MSHSHASRKMLLNLAESLEMSQRERIALLLADGYAPRYGVECARIQVFQYGFRARARMIYWSIVYLPFSRDGNFHPIRSTTS